MYFGGGFGFFGSSAAAARAAASSCIKRSYATIFSQTLLSAFLIPIFKNHSSMPKIIKDNIS